MANKLMYIVPNDDTQNYPFNTQLNEPTNHNTPKMYYRILGTSVIISPLSPINKLM